MQQTTRFIIGLSVAAFGFFNGQPANATCGSANCSLVTGTQENLPAAGHGVVDLSYRYLPMDLKRHGSDPTNEVLTPGIDFENGVVEPDHHRELRTDNELVQMDVSYGLTERLSASVALPLINDRRHEHIHMDSGEFTNTDGSSGFGDVRVNLKYAMVQSLKQLFSVGVGVKAPTGEYKLRDSDSAINEPTIMPGTGSWDGLLSAFYGYQIQPHQLSLFASGSYQLNGENDLNYRFGDTLLANGGVTYRLTSKLLSSLQLNLRTSDRDEFLGQRVPSTGGTWLYLTPGITLETSGTTALYAHLQLPVYQYVNDSNLVPRYGLMIGASHSFE